MSETIKGYKAVNKDLTARGDYSYANWEQSPDYDYPGKPEICNNGGHYCEKAVDIFNYCHAVNSRFFEVEDIGTERDSDGKKTATNKLRFIREVSQDEMRELCGNDNLGEYNTGKSNTGDSNTGNRNIGDNNTGNRNIGNRNTGYANIGTHNTAYGNIGNNNTGNRNNGDNNTGDGNTGDGNTGKVNYGDGNTGYANIGDGNTGDWNKADFQTGFFNTKASEDIDVFNKKCSKKEWDECDKPSFFFRLRLNTLVPWEEMSDQEKIDNEFAYTQYGYLKSISVEEAWAEAFKTATHHDIELLKALPNYDYNVFREITGIEDERLK